VQQQLDEQKKTASSATSWDIHDVASAMVSMVEIPMLHVSDETQDAVKQRTALLCK
jgi:aspartate/glutamate racemase